MESSEVFTDNYVVYVFSNERRGRGVAAEICCKYPSDILLIDSPLAEVVVRISLNI